MFHVQIVVPMEHNVFRVIRLTMVQLQKNWNNIFMVVVQSIELQSSVTNLMVTQKDLPT